MTPLHRVSLPARVDLRGKEQEADRTCILVVDDEENIALTMGELLRRRGYSVEIALSGQEALDCLEESEFDLVLTDLKMEGVDGISILEEVRRRFPMTISIILTGYASLESAIAAIRRSAYDYLVKPCPVDELIRTIQHGIEHRRVQLREMAVRRELEKLNAELEQRVTERVSQLKKLNEDLVRANQVKDIFFATVSHELRTPLNAIIGWTSLLRSKNLQPSEVERALEIIERNAQHQAQLVSDLLELSGIAAGKLRLEMQPVNLLSAIHAAADSVSPMAQAKGMVFENRLQQSSDLVVGDAVRLQQVFANIFSNAVKFSPERAQVTVTVRSTRRSIEVQVADAGKGIEADFLPHVFDSFSQADSSLTRSHGGLGLGLAVAKSIIEIHGGAIGAQSPGPGKGATFTVRLPLADLKTTPEEQGHAQDGGPSKREPLLKEVKIVVVEDHPDTLELITGVLEREGAVVTGFSNGENALRSLPGIKPDLLISDVAMPGLDGYEFIRKVRSMAMHIPAVALTAFAATAEREAAIRAGYDRHISKPTDPESLVRTISELVAKR